MADAEVDVARLLEHLCVRLGFCLDPTDWQRIVDDPPTTVDAFTDTVIMAEGLDPVVIDSGLRQQVHELVRAALQPEATTGLPRGRRRGRGQVHDAAPIAGRPPVGWDVTTDEPRR